MRAALRAAEGGHIRACSSACGDHMVPGLGYDRWRPYLGAVWPGALKFVSITLGVLLAPLLCAVGTQDGHCTRWGRVTCARHCSETPTHAIGVPVCSRHEPKRSNTTHFETFCVLGHPPMPVMEAGDGFLAVVRWIPGGAMHGLSMLLPPFDPA